jgi:hypothetical protein
LRSKDLAEISWRRGAHWDDKNEKVRRFDAALLGRVFTSFYINRARFFVPF